MKAYLMRNSSPLPPFQKPASQVRFQQVTIRDKLIRQLEQSGFDVVDMDASVCVSSETNAVELEELATKTIAPQSIVLQDDLFLSNNFLENFIAAIPDRRRSYQCEINAAYYPLFFAGEPEPSMRKLPLYYVGSHMQDNWESVLPLVMHPSVLFEFNQSVPARIHTVVTMRANLLDYYAIHISYWPDLHFANTLYSKEFISKLILLTRNFLPQWLIDKCQNWRWLKERYNSIGKNCLIHPTAVLEGCVIGDNVEIGPYCYLRAAVVGDGTVITEHSSVNVSTIGRDAYIIGARIINSYVGDETTIAAPMLYNVIFGERGFISGGSGFADFNVGAGSVVATIEDKDIATGMMYLGSCVGDDCFIGANLIFAPGRSIPDGTKFLDNGLVKDMPTQYGGSYVLSGNQFLQIPDSFLRNMT